MAVPLAEREYTLDEFMRLQSECQTEESRYRGFELDEGLIPMSPIEGYQSGIWGSLIIQVGGHVQSGGLGQVLPDCLLDLGNRRRYFPDLAFLSNEDLKRYDGRRLPVPSTLLVEIAVQDSLVRDTGPKKAVYYGLGVAWYWIVNLVDQRIEEYRRGPAGHELVSEVGLFEPFRPALFPGLIIQLRPPASAIRR
jgi:Uma2 family endonuclease